MSLFLLILILGLLVAVAVFIDAVMGAPEGLQGEEGFTLAPAFAEKPVPETSSLLKAKRGAMGGVSVATAVGS